MMLLCRVFAEDRHALQNLFHHCSLLKRATVHLQINFEDHSDPKMYFFKLNLLVGINSPICRFPIAFWSSGMCITSVDRKPVVTQMKARWSVSVCVCSCKCSILRARIHLSIAKWGYLSWSCWNSKQIRLFKRCFYFYWNLICFIVLNWLWSR